MEQLTIGEVARRAGIRASAIRYYESINLLPAPERVSGQRRYDASILRRLAFIQVAQAAGFTVAEMQLLFQDLGAGADTPMSQRWQTLAHHKLIQVDALINRAHGMRQLLEQGLRCGCTDLEDCINCVLANCIG